MKKKTISLKLLSQPRFVSCTFGVVNVINIGATLFPITSFGVRQYRQMRLPQPQVQLIDLDGK